MVLLTSLREQLGSEYSLVGGPVFLKEVGCSYQKKAGHCNMEGNTVMSEEMKSLPSCEQMPPLYWTGDENMRFGAKGGFMKARGWDTWAERAAET